MMLAFSGQKPVIKEEKKKTHTNKGTLSFMQSSFWEYNE